jgi:sterol desaturase/sphingolipid hydroxylase (fatty acid hydroxylase superfamily)
MQRSPAWYFANLFLPLGVAFVIACFVVPRLGWPDIAWWMSLVVAGAALWTLLEYVIHRLLLHRVAIFKRYHDAHHASPDAYISLPPFVGIGLIILLSYVPFLAFAPVLATGLTVGMLSGYTAYAVIHHACHALKPKAGSFLYRAWLAHAVHHYRHGEGNFGVTTSIWDHVFGTRITPASRARSAGAGSRVSP